MSTPDPNSNSKQKNWLAQQWAKVRGGDKRDVIIAQIGDDAENIAVGKNIWQINVAGRNLTLPILIATACLLAIVGYFLYRQYEYVWNPTQMTGTFNIAVAEFGEVNTNGSVGGSEHGASLSETVFESIQREYADHPTLNPEDVTIWHDSLGRDVKNIRIGVITGRDKKEREKNAAAIAGEINADLVIYGQLDSTGSPDSLALEFFYQSDKVRNELSATQGQYEVGPPIQVVPSFAEEPSLARMQINEPLEARAKALSLIAIGLTYDVLGDVENSLIQFQRAADELEQLDDKSGLESTYYFVGRAALLQDDDVTAEEAFMQAVALNPTYVRAQVGLGGVFLKRTQRIDAGERLQNSVDLDKAIEAYQTAQKLAVESGNALHATIAQLALGSALRIRGEASYFTNSADPGKGEDAVALSFFEQAVAELSQTTSPLEAQEQYRLVAQAFQSQGVAHYQAASIHRQQSNQAGNAAELEKAIDSFAGCIEQREHAPEDAFLIQNIIGKSCQPLHEQAQTLLDSP